MYKNHEGYPDQTAGQAIRRATLKRCELCGKRCRKQFTIKNRINGNELKICGNCMKEFGFKQENNVTDSDTGKRR